MKEPNEQELFNIIAHHEAGHAVACYLLHKRFKYVTINPEEEKLGKIIFPEKVRRPVPSERELAVIKREYMVFLAGPIAEGILSGKCDFKDIIHLSSSPTEENRKFDQVFWKLHFIETKLLIYAPWNWNAVIALADELLTQRKIRYQVARKIIKKAIEDYHEGVRDGISALHYQSYSRFVERISDAKIKFKETGR